MFHRELTRSTARISIFKSVLDSPIVKMVLQLMDLADNETPGAEQISADIFRRLAESAELATGPMVGNAWQNLLLDQMLSDDNAFARKAEVSGLRDMGESLLSQVHYDLGVFRALYDLNIDALMDGFPSIDGFQSLQLGSVNEARLAMKRHLHESKDWQACDMNLAEYYHANGCGEFGKYRAFRWVRTSKGGRLQGVESPDPILYSDLVDYGWQRDAVRRNTAKLLAGYATNNMLLYGDRGTGKSSTVKSMLNEFAGSKLRLIEVAKENLIDLPDILSTIRRRQEKFILFLDDLSFEDNETDYKALKAVLEGGLEARPANVVLYATSNRRNLIRERFSERSGGDEVHPGDTTQEKLSLSDRFGLKVPFLSPDQDEYLRIVSTLASRAGIEMTDELRKQAVSWQHARSGRSARQFVDYIIGENALGENDPSAAD